MRSEDRDPAYLWNAVQAGRALQKFVAEHTFEDYFKDEVLKSAVERKFEVFGEAIRKVSETLRRAHPEIPWSRMVGLRNIVAHRYYAIDHAILWDIIHTQLAEMLERLEHLIPPLPPEDDER